MIKIFTYGSLMSKKSIENTLGYVPPYKIATLKNYKRDVNATWTDLPNKDARKPFYSDGKLLDFNPAYMNLVESKGAETVGVVYSLTEDDKVLLDKREGLGDGYDLLEVHTSEGPALVYLSVDYSINENSKVASSYLQVCEENLPQEAKENYYKQKEKFSLPIIQTDFDRSY